MISALTYHLETSYDRFDMKGHTLDWANQPSVFKHYPGLEVLPLPQGAPFMQDRLSQILQKRPMEPPPDRITTERLARIFRMAYTLTARKRYPGGDFYYRSAPSAGALYPCELYIGGDGVSGLEAGLYHYAVHAHALAPLREGGLAAFLEEAMASRAGGALPIVTFFISVIFFRSAWKYRERAYRYHLMDTGHLAESLAIALRSEGLCFNVDEDFHDEAINDLLALDAAREACLTVLRVWGGHGGSGKGEPPSLSAADLTTASQVAPREVQYPIIQEIHRSTSMSIKDPGEVPDMSAHLGVEPHGMVEVPEPRVCPDEIPYGDAVGRRRSKRNFIAKALTEDQWGAMVRMLRTHDSPLSPEPSLKRGAVCIGLLAGHAQGLEPGFYLVDRSAEAVHLVTPGRFTGKMARSCLEQEWLANAALQFLFLTNLALLDHAWGPRGYRYAMMAAGRWGQRIYLAATAMGLGCCGIGALYDEEAARLLGLNESSRLLYLVAMGPVKG